MGTRFIGKNVRKMVVKPIKNSSKHQNVIVANAENKVEAKENKIEIVEDKVLAETSTKKENKRQKKSKEMVSENKLSQLETIAGTANPSVNVKVEKTDKGLFERTENSTVLLTEDNKMLLND